MKQIKFLLLILMALVTQGAWGQIGSKNNPYLIGTASDLQSFRDLIDSLSYEETSQVMYAKLTADIDFGNGTWKPAGSYKPAGSDQYVRKSTIQMSFDGGGHTIKNLVVENDRTAETGMFIRAVGIVDDKESCVFKNLVLDNIRFSTQKCDVQRTVGLLCGSCGGYVKNITLKNSTLYVPNTEYVGGLFGEYSGYSGYDSHKIGISDVKIENCNITGGGYIGGLYGCTEQTARISVVEGCHVVGGSISGNAYVGGLIGVAAGKIINCSNSATITGIKNESSNDGAYCIGGIAGWGYYLSTIALCANYGEVSGSKKVAGICGVTDNSSTPELKYCMNMGTVTGGVDGKVGNFIVRNDVSNRVFASNCVYDSDKNGWSEDDSQLFNQEECAFPTEAFADGRAAYQLFGLYDFDDCYYYWGQNLTIAPKDPHPMVYTESGHRVVREFDSSCKKHDLLKVYRYFNGDNNIETWVHPNILHFEAKSASCVPGNIEYWKCEECGLCWNSEACDDEHSINSGDTEIRATGVHNHVVHVEAKPCCIEDGNAEYWKCEDCGTIWADKELTDVVRYEGYLNTYVSGHKFEGDHCSQCGMELRVLKVGDNGGISLRKFEDTENWYDWDFFAFNSKSASYITATLQSTYGCEFILFDENRNEIELNNQNVASAKRKVKGSVQSPIDHIVIGKGWYYIGIKNLLVDNVANENLFIEVEEIEPLHNFDENGECIDEGCDATVETCTTRHHVSTISVPTDFTKFYKLDVKTEGYLDLVYRAAEDGKKDFIIYNEDWIEQNANYNYEEGIHDHYLTLYPGTYYYAFRSENTSTDIDLEVYFYCYDGQHDKEKVDGKPATCKEDGWKEHYICTNCGTLFVEERWGGLNEKGYDMEESGIIIPAGAHALDENGVCSGCGNSFLLAEGEKEFSIPAGSIKKTAFMFKATETKLLEVSVTPGDAISDVDIMTWSEWVEKQAGGGNDRLAAPRKTEGREEPAPGSYTISDMVVENNTYAIVLTTSAEDEISATISLSCSDIVYPKVKVGTNVVRIESTPGYDDTVPECYNLFKFVAPVSGSAHFYTEGGEDTYGMLFSSKFESLNSNDDDGFGYNFRIDCDVVEGLTYYIGVRQYSGNFIGNYSLVIEIDGYTPPAELKPLVLSTEENGSITDIPLNQAVDDYFGKYTKTQTFVVGGVTYTRPMNTSKWGTVILPYELKSNDNVAYYELVSADIPNASLEFSKVSVVEPNTPVVYHVLKGDVFDASVEGAVNIDYKEQVPIFKECIENGDEQWSMLGFYAEFNVTQEVINGLADNNEGLMFISKDKFYHAEGPIKIKPYRAIFDASGVNWSAPSAKSMTISFKDEDDSVTTIQSVMNENGEFTDIESIYDLNGRKIDAMKRGINIISTADGKTRKFIKK